MSEHDIKTVVEKLFDEMVNKNASDLYITVGMCPALRVDNRITQIGSMAFDSNQVEEIIDLLIDEEQKDEFETTHELNFSINWHSKSRFRLNLFRQQQNSGIVIRRIQTDIPTLEELNLPDVYAESVMHKKGLVLLVGGTGAGKSSSLAAMLGYRNQNGTGHIITVEDPIEFVHQHNKCIFTQREVGIDTYSYGMALQNALRQRPDVVVIGEIRDRETMDHALNFAITGHLCIATLHANNSNQAIERIVNFFPEEEHRHILVTLSQVLINIISQKVVLSKQGESTLVMEIMSNIGLVRTLIEDGKIKEIKEAMERITDSGMRTFDQSLLELYSSGILSEEIALAEADNPANLRLRMRQHDSGASSDITSISSDI